MPRNIMRDSANGFTVTFKKLSDNSVQDISGYTLRFEFYMDGTTLTLTMGSGLSYVTDGTDGKVAVNLTKEQSNQFCIGKGRLRVFNDAGSDPICIDEGSFVVEGKSFDA